MNEQSLQHLLALHYVYPLTFNVYKKMIQSIVSIDNLSTISPTKLANILQTSLKKSETILQNYLKMLQVDLLSAYEAESIKTIPYNDKYYPKSLFELVDPPTVLYAKGDVTLLTKERKIAIVGSRNATNYSSMALDFIIPPLVEQNFVIVSGLAKGADSLAHTSTIHYGGKTIGVLGNGFFHVYPRENRSLTEEMVKNHLLITEYPPYVGPKKWQFPMRNRIISGISEAIVVTEAALSSGTLITTDHALEHGKDIFVVPGPIHSELSKGTNQLLKEGAIPIWNGYQIVEERKLFLGKY
ncbi:DNA-processing protein DprA [Ureibacillus sp. MALMAid1270]|uniref:DNA-processing protein DprA n=1 Tax=Ureibacillus sp. MALMAid1270 TaxID=3411629 RepID=UPI003BA78D2F